VKKDPGAGEEHRSIDALFALSNLWMSQKNVMGFDQFHM
jgi:hypothetical protein